ncbi:MAG: 2-oxo acid dehydrogenase subunit E2, partial [Nocardioides sp.]
MYERYKQDPNSVDKAWWDFFRNYHEEHGTGSTSNGAPSKPAPAAETKAPEATAPEAKVPEKAPEKAAETKPAAPAAPKKTSPATDVQPKADMKPAQPAAAPVPKEPEPAAAAEASDEPTLTTLRGAPARTVQNMDVSLSVPTATSVRSVPVKLLIDNRTVINNHLARARGGKVSFTHLIGYALVKALKQMPEMNNGFDVVDGKPTLIQPAHINLGLAIDLPKPDGTRQLLVPSIKAAENMDFAAFWTAYEDIVRKARSNKLAVTDFQGTTISLTNPGTIGTNHSVPRLMKGQGAIVGVGSMDYPPEFQGASEETLTRNAVSKVMTLTSTYDHRVIQGAQSGEFLKRLHALLLGENDFYDEIFRALRIPYEPIRWAHDISANHDDEISKQARILELIHAYRVRG